MLGLAMHDSELLARAWDETALEYAFRSGEPQRIASISAVYAKKYVADGDKLRAKALITRALRIVDRVDHAGDLLALSARYGRKEDAVRAKQLLIERNRLPHSHVTEAYLAVWETHAAMRRRATSEAVEHARRAAHLFERLGWKQQQEEVLEVAGARVPRAAIVADERSEVQHAYAASTYVSFVSILTKRERQVAELVLRGLSNRGIAQMLSITEHTVEAHMTSIFNRLGLRSRWQLIDLSR
jgi:ATP/maltotriose-dependent transcriptional regulator MalT